MAAALLLLGGLLTMQIFSKKSNCFSKDFIYASPATLSTLEEKLPPLHFSSPPFDLTPFLNQPFYYLGSGNQMFAFLSQDETLVLKFIKFHTFPIWNDSPKKWGKWERVLNSFYLADKYGKENSGLLYVHLPGDALSFNPVTLYDQAGKNHVVDLNQVFFAVQRKAIPTGTYLRRFLDKDDPQAALTHLLALLNFFDEEWQHDLYDNDHNIMINTGFVDDRPIRIDTGKLTQLHHPLSEKERMKEREKLINQRILPWIKKRYPHFLEFFSSKIRNPT